MVPQDTPSASSPQGHVGLELHLPEDNDVVSENQAVILKPNTAYHVHRMTTLSEDGLYTVAVSMEPTCDMNDYYVNDDYRYSVDNFQHDYI